MRSKLIIFSLIIFTTMAVVISYIVLPDLLDKRLFPDIEPTPTLSSNYQIVDSGQTICSDNSQAIDCPEVGKLYYGQDAQYEGNVPSYTDNGDGTVTDDVTGLMWQQDPGEKVEYAQAVAGAEDFALAGYTDWRLPSIKELYSLINFSGVDPSSMDGDTTGLTPFIDRDYFDFSYGDTAQGDRIIDSQWATSSVYNSTVMNGQECFFGVNFADGRIKCYPTRNGKGYFVIYVRGNNYGENNFAVNGNTVIDAATGLTWQQADSATGMNWQDALVYCENLELDGYTDWRVPNAKELQSIVDYSRSPDITDSAAIDPLFNASTIENELGEQDYPFYWSSTTHIRQGNVFSEAAYVSFGRALGYMAEFGGWVDVHGAGAQRSDPKIGDPADYPQGNGPQGDARRIYNYVRCVRSDNVKMVSGDPAGTVPQATQTNSADVQTPPTEAVAACNGKSESAACSFAAPNGNVSGTCRTLGGDLACVP